MTLRYERRGAGAWLVLDRPERRNALTVPMITAMDVALDRAEADPGVRAIVVTGAGPAFCAGADLDGMLAALDDPQGLAAYEQDFLHPLARTFSRLRSGSLPVVAAVNGACAAGGLELVLCCDLVLAAQGATFTDAHSRRGIAPAVGAVAALVERIGRARATDLLMVSGTWSAGALADAGLIRRVVPDGELEEATDELVATLADRSRASLATMKRMLGRARTGDWNEQVAADLGEFHAGWGSTDMLEGVRSYVERRPASFR